LNSYLIVWVNMMFSEMGNRLTIVLPVFDEPAVVAKFVKHNESILKKYPLFVLDRKGGDVLKKYAAFYKKTSCPTIGLLLGSSRRFLIRRVQTEFTLNLDGDVLLPANFVEEALKKFENPRVVAVALDYTQSQGHAAFGPSIWRTSVLQKMYDWKFLKTIRCECLYMWDKLREEGYEVDTLDMRAIHLKSWGDFITQRNGGFQYHAWKILLHIPAGIRYRALKNKPNERNE